MASLLPERRKYRSAPEHSTQAEMHPQRKGRETDANGHETDVKYLPSTPINWEPVEGVTGPAYEDYKVIIMTKRAPDLFPAAQGKSIVSTHMATTYSTCHKKLYEIRRIPRKFCADSVRIPQSFCAANRGIAVLLPRRVSPISAE